MWYMCCHFGFLFSEPFRVNLQTSFSKLGRFVVVRKKFQCVEAGVSEVLEGLSGKVEATLQVAPNRGRSG
jgi:hypothetical protein